MNQTTSETTGQPSEPYEAAREIRVLVPGNHLMVGLLGQRDELLRLVEAAFPVSIHVRGNEITIRGATPTRSASLVSSRRWWRCSRPATTSIPKASDGASAC